MSSIDIQIIKKRKYTDIKELSKDEIKECKLFNLVVFEEMF
jgi:hypothetical protein